MAIERVQKKEKKILEKVPDASKKKRDETKFLDAAYRYAPDVEWETIPDLDVPRMVVEISGAEGSGKTHAALSFPKPALLDTEGKAWVVMKKFGNTKLAKASNFEDVLAFVKAVVNDNDIETAIFDSSRDIVDMAERYSLEQLGKETLYSSSGGQVLYTHVYQKMDWIIKTLRKAGKNVVFTSRMKDEYKNNTRTGHQVRDGYKKVPYQADVVIELRSSIVWDDETHILFSDVTKITKNGYVRKKNKKPYIHDALYDTLVENIFDTIDDQDEYMTTFIESAGGSNNAATND